MLIKNRILFLLENKFIEVKGYNKFLNFICMKLNISFEEVKKEVDELLKSGEIYQTEKDTFVSSKAAGLIIGKILSSSKDYAFCEPLDDVDNDIFLAPRNIKGALNKDIVLCKVLKEDFENKKREGVVLKILKRESAQLVGTYHSYKGYGLVSPDDIRLNRNIYVNIKDSLKAAEGDKVVAVITDFKDKKGTVSGKVIEVIGDINKKGNDILSIIRNYKLYEKFPESVEAFAESVPQEVTEKSKKNRKDLTGLLTFTIDGEDAKDLDDAVSLEMNSDGSYRLGVHIADVGHYVQMDSILDKEAFNRATSVYFPDRVLPMLPRQLSNGICSLNEGVERLTLSVFMDIDKNAKLLRQEICESFIKTKHRLTYTTVQKLLDGDKASIKKYNDIYSTILNMDKLTDILEAFRIKRGALDFDIPETYVELDENGKTVNIRPRERKKAHRIIESFMIACNETVAKFFKERKVPFVYRIHEKPAIDKMTAFTTFLGSLGVAVDFDLRKMTPKDLQELLEKIKDLPYKSVVNTVMLRSLKKAKYLEQCLGHFGLASEFYCHFTSPIRRYPDLVIHRIIKLYLKNVLQKNKSFLENYVAKAALQSSEREKLADEAERAVDDLKKAEYMKGFIGVEFDGIISGVSPKGLFVELENTCEGFIRVDKLPEDFYLCDDVLYQLNGKFNKFRLGGKLKIRVESVNLFERKVDFDFIKKLENS